MKFLNAPNDFNFKLFIIPYPKNSIQENLQARVST